MVSTGLVVALLGVIAFTGLHWASMPLSAIEPIDPTTLHISGEFVEQNLGAQLRPDGSVIVRLIAQQYAFNPQCIEIPVNTKITFRGTSADVVHGFLVTGTNANAMLVPGYITTFSTQFSHLGDHLMPCHEYCGTGHAAMWAHVRVVPSKEFERNILGNEGGHCD
ncbi:MAG: cytochrome C oxidase subunit II [Gammaproteobacteria bacterium]